MKRAAIIATIAITAVQAVACATPEPVTVIVEREVTRIVEVTRATGADNASGDDIDVGDVNEIVRDPSEVLDWDSEEVWINYYLECLRLNPDWHIEYIDASIAMDEPNIAEAVGQEWAVNVIASDGEDICRYLAQAMARVQNR